MPEEINEMDYTELMEEELRNGIEEGEDLKCIQASQTK